MKVKRKIRVRLKPTLAEHPSLRYKYDPKQSDEMHPLHQGRARETDTLRVLRYRVNLAIDDLIKEGTLHQLNALTYMLQGFESQMLYGMPLPVRKSSLSVRPKPRR